MCNNTLVIEKYEFRNRLQNNLRLQIAIGNARKNVLIEKVLSI